MHPVVGFAANGLINLGLPKGELSHGDKAARFRGLKVLPMDVLGGYYSL